MASASTLDSSQLLVERDEVDMEIEREGEGQINIKELESYLNSIILESKTKISFCSQAKALIAKQSKAEALIAKQSKAKEILEQKNEELNGQIQSASNENLTLKNQNEQFNKEIEELLENKRQNELLLKRIMGSKVYSDFSGGADLYCTVLYCSTVLYCTVQYLYSTVLLY